ncbi:efflux RND transporter periplasmic adaptor subunit [Halodesulfovibrio marinisediminis]|uniref:RND family efflux transporter, MFP subunit n=1 Tax=Halodesulfovibrio marinisediminis DSM 17456 TaxID=1121457 RepID=A0A1N6E940_9BACT|nr:efflux RND transporter periplasmic adaptor subunit [Halodesulfovibrio marinisediminis]SIN79513.1 RND family efflux transporter, MFP subunit [Halodesulfovibrio marinisediminis DSM 17456]
MQARLKISFLFLMVMITAGFWGCGSKEEAELPSKRVIVYRVPNILKFRTWSTSGTAKDVLETILSFRVSGMIISLPVDVGQKVLAGDLVAELDPTDYLLELREAKASLQDILAELRNAKLDHDRKKKLVKQDVISLSEYDLAASYLDSMRAKADAQRERIAIAERNLSYTRLYVPEAGTISSVPAEVHTNVGIGEPVATLNSRGSLEMDIGVPDRLIAMVKLGQPVTIRFDVFRDMKLDGRVKEVGVRSNETSTFPVTISIDTKDKRIRSGMVGETTFSFEQVEKYRHVVVPAAAIFGLPNDNKYVWVVNPEEKTVHMRKVEILLPAEGGIIVSSGLNPEELVVIRGVHSLQEGQKVRIQEQ